MSTAGFLLLIAALFLAVVLVIGFIAYSASRVKDTSRSGEWSAADSDLPDTGGDSGSAGSCSSGS
ncbi:hypothetical protein [Nocardia sp. NPDC057353]|uniref:hypothetical protein n=1 Tax=Nocardia sp. NPDC057353 TaxID=3346104 RepID=UPI003624B13D